MNSVEKACRITSGFEGRAGFASLSGNFDGQGMSFGFLQFNAGQDTLRPILRDCFKHMPETMVSVFGVMAPTLKAALVSKATFVDFAKRISALGGRTLQEPWKSLFIKLGNTAGCQKIQMSHAQKYVTAARIMMAAYQCRSERAFCFFFDVAVQNGSVVKEAAAYYDARVKPGMSELERLALLAKAVAVGAIDRWEADVFARKQAIVDGKGIVHGTPVKFELSDGPAQL